MGKHQKESHQGVSLLQMGWSSKATTHEGTARICLLLATDTGRCRDLCEDLSCANKTKWGNISPGDCYSHYPSSAYPSPRDMDFIIGLPKSEGYGSIIVVVDRFTKYATFIAAPKDCTAAETARLFLKNVVNVGGYQSSSSVIVTLASLGSFEWIFSSSWAQSFISLLAFTLKLMGRRNG